MTSPYDPNLLPPLPLSVTKYLPLELPTSILVCGELHSLIFHDHFVEKCHSWRPPKHHDDAMHGKKFCECPLIVEEIDGAWMEKASRVKTWPLMLIDGSRPHT